MAQTKGQRRAQLRKKRLKKRVKQVLWACLFVAVGAALVHQPMTADAQTKSASTSQNLDGTKAEAFLLQAMSAANVTPTNYAIHDWTNLNQQFMSEDHLASIGTQLEQEFDLNKAKITSRSESNETFWQVDGTWPNSTNVQIVLTSFPATTDGSGTTAAQTVLTVTALNGSASTKDFAASYDRIEQLVASVQGTPQMSAYFAGAMKSQLSEQDANQLVNRVFSAVNASPVESLKGQWDTSVSGYTPNALTYIYTNGKRMNLQVAVHDDTYHHDTNVLVGTPIITTTY
ncbi:YwmB family TATA-box binding protein [Alicyclobacillus fodiniaquatilis]|uniref:YwmB family TATA-box binding protein n=1 Tax=Alicyclobacillus fodiniaquatilis TaxID=1661150 RepID=A0ABW4JJ15_9BACL